MKMIVRLLNQAAKIKRQRAVILDLMKDLEAKKHHIDFLYREIARRDKKIKELNARLNFFGILIGTEEQPEVDFPETTKI